MEQIEKSKRQQKLMIINRSFWPRYPIIGEALLHFAEIAHSKKFDVYVVIQDPGVLRDSLSRHARGTGLKFMVLRALTSSSSHLISRIFELILFSLWVIWSLFKTRPQKIYVSSDPPVVIPFIVMCYSKLMRCQFYYHLQDIHPEVGAHIYGTGNIFTRFLIKIDSLTLRNADGIATITNKMMEKIKERSETKSKITCIDNPAFEYRPAPNKQQKRKGVVFCGNAGRLQLMPLILSSLDEFYSRGGWLPVVFAGGGIYENELLNLSKKHKYFTFLGKVSPKRAANLAATYQWGLIPIKGNATDFAFPSKTSTYLMCDTNILLVSSSTSFIASWVNENEIGICVNPKQEDIVNVLFQIENDVLDFKIDPNRRHELKENLKFDTFVSRMSAFVCL